MHRHLAAALAVAAAGVGLTVATGAPAAADPNVPCGSRSTYISAGNYYNLTYRNCGSSTVRVVAHDESYGQWGDCRSVAGGQWISWTQLPAPAWNNNWVARPC
ncbi:hypothetical protein Kfla_5986 [Kribbella flavida DSM 17836]|uniref:Secreted protein n=1 Tax=Kribbella flavida (strain DSM 17836 / JCM 10339 / NBRC 14399) TaxID=479435 RepID=D2PST7_KRIFD|nr:hypothetical protein [Kribbella flavida]ADB34989.1 hypothetical protein Kfla_5986 [Kribbella flavida DSM 17836]